MRISNCTTSASSTDGAAVTNDEGELFKRCRRALGLSQPAIARALLVASDRTIRRWEGEQLAIAGPAWVALEYMLRGCDEIVIADQVAEVVRRRRLTTPDFHFQR